MIGSNIIGKAVLAASIITVVNGGCPYIPGNEAPKPRPLLDPAQSLEKRFHTDSNFGRCPRKRLSKYAGGGSRSWDWWPCELSLHVLRQNGKESNPMGADFIYANEFAKLDFEELKKDITELQTTSQDWWPADFGNYGGFWIRLSWHNAGTYRAVDGRGGAGEGQQRFAPLNSWPDNANLDKARRLLWPIKQKYGSKISWADLFVLAGHTAMVNMGFPPHGFAAGRVDSWQADEGIYWGSEEAMFPSEPDSNNVRYNGSTNIYTRADKLESPLADSNMGLIYVDPEGPSGIPDPKASALDIRMTFSRMAMNDEETVALIAGGHAFGKTHGAVLNKYIGPEPNAAPLVQQQLGWHNSFKTGNADYTSTSGLEVIWSNTPTKWANEYLHSLLTRNFSLTKSPAGGHQWECLSCNKSYPDAFKPNVFHRPKMMTSDIALKADPIYRNICETYYKDFNLFTEKFGLAWYKLLHRDMGPITRYLGPDIPKGPLKLWQDPVPDATYQMIDANDISSLKSEILNTRGLNISNLVTTAWGAAASFRISDKRGGANGGRIQLQPQIDWPSNNPARLRTVLDGIKSVQSKFNKANSVKQVSLADLIVLGGTAAVEAAAKAAGMDLNVRFTPGRNDTTQALTDVSTFKYLQPVADGFVNYGVGNARSTTEEILVDKAGLLSLSIPEMTVLVGGMRALNANYDGSNYGIFTDRPGQLTNDFFVNLLNITTEWQPISHSNQEFFQGNNRYNNQPQYTATRSDLIFGSHPELRAVAEVYASLDASQKFAKDFASAWSKVMELDRYDFKNRMQDEVQLD